LADLGAAAYHGRLTIGAGASGKCLRENALRIAYGVHGYGRGHAARAQAVLPALTARHDVLILAGGDAHQALAGETPVTRIPHLRYHLDPRGKLSTWRSLARNTPAALDLLVRGPAFEMVREGLREFGPDVVISDSDGWTHRVAAAMGIPRISFDHFGVLVWCRWPMRWWQRVMSRFESLCYRRLMGRPERIVVASFYDDPPRREGVRGVGPVLRQAVLDAAPSRGEHLLVYFSNGERHFTPRVEGVLAGLDCAVVVYGTARRGSVGNLDFRPPGNVPFVRDLASCRGVFATAGNQLICEAMHFAKPMLLMPEDSLEQRLNAEAVARMEIGMQARRQRGVTGALLREFLDGEARFADHLRRTAETPRCQAVDAIEAYIAELT